VKQIACVALRTRLFAIVPSVGSRAALSSPFLLNGYRSRILLALPSHTSDGLGINFGIGAMVGSATRKLSYWLVIGSLSWLSSKLRIEWENPWPSQDSNLKTNDLALFCAVQ